METVSEDDGDGWQAQGIPQGCSCVGRRSEEEEQNEGRKKKKKKKKRKEKKRKKE